MKRRKARGGCLRFEGVRDGGGCLELMLALGVTGLDGTSVSDWAGCDECE